MLKVIKAHNSAQLEYAELYDIDITSALVLGGEIFCLMNHLP